jgi:hypothetical protein
MQAGLIWAGDEAAASDAGSGLAWTDQGACPGQRAPLLRARP